MSKRTETRLRVVQVFTYKELEVATEGFSEANVIGNGGFGLNVMYRGILSDGTLAAIKLLRRQGKQEERAFRIEVSFILWFNYTLSIDSFHLRILQVHILLHFELSVFVLSIYLPLSVSPFPVCM